MCGSLLVAGLLFGAITGAMYNRLATGLTYGPTFALLLFLTTAWPLWHCNGRVCFKHVPCWVVYVGILCVMALSMLIACLASFRLRQYALYNTASLASYILHVPHRQMNTQALQDTTGSFEHRLKRVTSSRVFMPPAMDAALDNGTFTNQYWNGFHLDGLYKHDAIPTFFRDIALPRKHWGTGFRGRTVFLTNVLERGTLKQRYMMALTQDKIDHYVRMQTPRLTSCMHTVASCHSRPNTTCVHDTVRRCVRDVVFYIHTERNMSDTDRRFYDSGFAALNAINNVASITDVLWMRPELWKHIQKHDDYIKTITEHDRNGGMFADWIAQGFSAEDVSVEYLHNIFAAGMQWTDTFEKLLREELPNPITTPWVYEILRLNAVSPFVVSSTTPDGQINSDTAMPSHVIHLMRPIMRKYGPHNMTRLRQLGQEVVCPVSRKSITSLDNAQVVSGTRIIEAPGNWAFGRGPRRCAGEVLSIAFIKTWLKLKQTLYPSMTYKRGNTSGLMGLGYVYRSFIHL